VTAKSIKYNKPDAIKDHPRNLNHAFKPNFNSINMRQKEEGSLSSMMKDEIGVLVCLINFIKIVKARAFATQSARDEIHQAIPSKGIWVGNLHCFELNF
jgi:hypothetical protein